MRIPGPTDLFRLVEQGYQAAEQVITLMPRLLALVGEVEGVVSRADELVQRVGRLSERASELVGNAADLLDRAGGAVTDAEQLTGEARSLLEPVRPALLRLEQIADRIAQTTSPTEVDAVVQVVDMLPEVVGSMRADILPILNTLDTVAPDLRDLLDVSRELNEILGAIPGLRRAKQRIEQEQAEH